jgi:protoheme IX farnesyltransferase
MQTLPSEVPLSVKARPLRHTVAAYFRLTKPEIIYLLLITTVPAMILAQRGVPSLWLMIATLIGGALAAGGANAINCYVDRDIDEIMVRTRSRPLPSGQVEPWRALVFGLTLGLLAFVWLAAAVNLLSAVLATAGLLFYVCVYTLWLKRSTPQNIVIGGAAGSVPPLVGWAAVTNGLSWEAIALFAIIFLWTPPHFWALALRYEADYARAGVPMLPVVSGGMPTRRQILAYTVALLGVSLIPWLLHAVGILYLIAALLLGGLFLWYAIRIQRDWSHRAVMGLFHYSIAYLGFLFAAVAIDQIARL